MLVLTAYRVVQSCTGSSVPWGARLSIPGRNSLQGVASYPEHCCLPSPLALTQHLAKRHLRRALICDRGEGSMAHLGSSLSLQLRHPVLEQGCMRRRAAAAWQAAGRVHPGLRSLVSAVVAAYRGNEVDRVLQGICKRGQQRCYILPCHIPEVALQGMMRHSRYPDQAGVTHCAIYPPKERLTQCADIQHTLMLLQLGTRTCSFGSITHCELSASLHTGETHTSMTSQKGDVSGGPGMSPGMTSAIGGPARCFCRSFFASRRLFSSSLCWI